MDSRRCPWTSIACFLNASLFSIPWPDCPHSHEVSTVNRYTFLCILLSVDWLLSFIFKFFEESLHAVGHFQLVVRWQFWRDCFRAHLGCRNLLTGFFTQGLGPCTLVESTSSLGTGGSEPFYSTLLLMSLLLSLLKVSTFLVLNDIYEHTGSLKFIWRMCQSGSILLSSFPWMWLMHIILFMVGGSCC